MPGPPVTTSGAPKPRSVPPDRYQMAVDYAILNVRERQGENCENEVRAVLEEAERWLREHPERL